MMQIDGMLCRYTLLNVDYYNVMYVQTKYIHLFGSVPTDGKCTEKGHQHTVPCLSLPFITYVILMHPPLHLVGVSI